MILTDKLVSLFHLATLNFFRSNTVDPTTPVIIATPADDRILRIIGTVFQTMIESKLTNNWMDVQLARIMGYITAVWPIIEPKFAGLIDPKAIIDRAFELLAATLVARPLLAFLVIQVHAFVDYEWDQAFPDVQAKLQAKGLV